MVKRSTPGSFSQGGGVPDFLDRAVTDGMRRLPMEVLFRVFVFKPWFFRTSRLVNRQWMNMTNQMLSAIRINGDFLSFRRAERAACVRFLARCGVLSRLTIRNVNALTDEDFAFLGKLQRLRVLKLGGCRGVTDDTVTGGISRCEELEELDLATSQVTDAGLAVLSRALPRLTIVNLYGCESVTNAGVEALLGSLARLRCINVRGTQVTSEGVQRMQTIRHEKESDVLVMKRTDVLVGPLAPESIYD